MQIKLICLLGGTGFVGRALANKLVKEGYQLRILTRNREKNRNNLILLPNVDLVETNIYNTEQLTTNLQGCDAVINLIGILNERGSNGKGFYRAHVSLLENLITACQKANVRRLLQMSSLNADAANGSSHYLRSKGEAEDKAHAAQNIHVTSFRPSIIFGPGDSFFNRFASLLKMTPLCFPLACANTRFSPVYVGDICDAFVSCLEYPGSYGHRYELCGPSIYSFKQLLEYTCECLDIKRAIIPLPDFVSRMQAISFDLLGFAFYILGMEKPFSLDNYLSTKKDSVCQCNDLKELNIEPKALETIVPAYLSNHSQRQRYDDFRKQAHR